MKRKIIKISIVLFVFLSIGSIGKTLVSHAEQSESAAVKKVASTIWFHYHRKLRLMMGSNK